MTDIGAASRSRLETGVASQDLSLPIGVYVPIPPLWQILLGLLGAAAFLSLWQVATVLELTPPRLLPSPIHVGATLVSLVQDGFLSDVLQSIYRIGASFFLAAAIAFPLGLAIGTFPAVAAFFSPLVSGFRYLPAPAFIPLLLMWLGAGDLQKIVFLLIGVVWFLITLIADHVRGVPRDLVDTARTLGASTRQLVWTVVAPASYPRIWEALRQMLAVSWTYLVIAEIVAATDGIGAVMMRAQRFIRVDEVMACIVTIGVLGVAFDFLFRLAGSYLFAYERISRS